MQINSVGFRPQTRQMTNVQNKNTSQKTSFGAGLSYDMVGYVLSRYDETEAPNKLKELADTFSTSVTGNKVVRIYPSELSTEEIKRRDWRNEEDCNSPHDFAYKPVPVTRMYNDKLRYLPSYAPLSTIIEYETENFPKFDPVVRYVTAYERVKGESKSVDNDPEIKSLEEFLSSPEILPVLKKYGLRGASYPFFKKLGIKTTPDRSSLFEEAILREEKIVEEYTTTERKVKVLDKLVKRKEKQKEALRVEKDIMSAKKEEIEQKISLLNKELVRDLAKLSDDQLRTYRQNAVEYQTDLSTVETQYDALKKRYERACLEARVLRNKQSEADDRLQECKCRYDAHKDCREIVDRYKANYISEVGNFKAEL